MLLSSKSLEQWQLRCVERLEQSADLAGVIVASSARGSGIDVEERFAHVPRLSVADLQDADGACDFVLRLGRVPMPWSSPPGRATESGISSTKTKAKSCPSSVSCGMTRTSRVPRSCEVRPRAMPILEEGFFPTNKLSYAAGRQRVEDAIAEWPARVCRRLGEPDRGRVAGTHAAVNAPNRRDRRPRLLPLRATIARRRLAWHGRGSSAIRSGTSA